MQILNPLPDLLAYSFLAPLLLRIVLSAYFLNQTYTIINAKFFQHQKIEIKNNLKILINLETISALALLVGFYTQIAVLILIATTLINLILDKQNGQLKKTKLQLYILIIIVLLTLLTTGAGFFSIDLPL